ncbi:MFS transporter [Oxalobacteraceae bacterium]|nr:MFS transporter [Oxalobacteraceae bacterium]
MTPAQPAAYRPTRHLFLFALALLFATQLGLSLYAWSLSERLLLPELNRKAQTSGSSMARKLERALDYGIPLRRMEGVGEYFDDVLKQNKDLAYLRVSDLAGATVFRSSHAPAAAAQGDTGDYLDTALPLHHQDTAIGWLHVGVDKGHLASRVRELRYDIGIVLLTSLLIAFEVLWFIVTFNVAEPGLQTAEQKSQQRVVLVRVLTFLFMFAEMLSRPFLPVYAAGLAQDIGLPEGLRASLPLSAFLLAVALAMPGAGRWSDHAGRRNSYVAGALLVVLGLSVTGLVPHYLALIAARATTGVGYALMFMSCQGYVFDHTGADQRAKGMALFVGAIMVAEICAPAVGGILADRIGYRMVFIVGAAIALAAALIAMYVLDNHKRHAAAIAEPDLRALSETYTAATPQPQPQPLTAAPALPLRQLAGNRRFLALAILTGIPAKFMYTGFLIFLVPLLLTSLGHSKSEIGRYTMLYGLGCLLLAPVFARLADRYNAYAALVAAGGLLTGLGMLPVFMGASAELVMLAIGALGIGQAMSISAQLVLVVRVTQAQTQGGGSGAVLGLFRLVERLGAAAGPVATGALVVSSSPSQAMLWLGGASVSASLLFALLFALPSMRRNSTKGSAGTATPAAGARP